MVGPVGPLATISREPGQARKGAAAAVTLCAGVWLAGFTSITTCNSLAIPSDWLRPQPALLAVYENQSYRFEIIPVDEAVSFMLFSLQGV